MSAAPFCPHLSDAEVADAVAEYWQLANDDAIRDAIDDRRIELGIVTARHPLALVPRGRPWPAECTGNFKDRRHNWLTVGALTACGFCGRIEGVDDVAALVGLDGWLLRLPGQLQAHQEGRL